MSCSPYYVFLGVVCLHNIVHSINTVGPGSAERGPNCLLGTLYVGCVFGTVRPGFGQLVCSVLCNFTGA